MEVKQLMAELKKMPPNAKVAMTAHDNRILEIQSFVSTVELRDFTKVREELKGNYAGDDFGIEGKVVLLQG